MIGLKQLGTGAELGCTFLAVECIGFVGRALLANPAHRWQLGLYIMETLLLLLAPTFFAGSIYMTFTRILRLTNGQKHCLLPATWLTKIFVSADAISFLLQAAGKNLSLSNYTTSTLHIISCNSVFLIARGRRVRQCKYNGTSGPRKKSYDCRSGTPTGYILCVYDVGHRVLYSDEAEAYDELGNAQHDMERTPYNVGDGVLPDRGSLDFPTGEIRWRWSLDGKTNLYYPFGLSFDVPMHAPLQLISSFPGTQ